MPILSPEGKDHLEDDCVSYPGFDFASLNSRGCPGHPAELLGVAVRLGRSRCSGHLKAELDKKRRGEGSELMDTLILYEWKEALGALHAGPRRDRLAIRRGGGGKLPPLHFVCSTSLRDIYKPTLSAPRGSTFRGLECAPASQ